MENFSPGMGVLPRKSKKWNCDGKTCLSLSRSPTVVAELLKVSSKSRVRTFHAKGAECSPPWPAAAASMRDKQWHCTTESSPQGSSWLQLQGGETGYMLIFCGLWPETTLCSTGLAGHRSFSKRPRKMCLARFAHSTCKQKHIKLGRSSKVSVPSVVSQPSLKHRFLHPHNTTRPTQRRQASLQPTATPCYQHLLCRVENS
jgi:hypothetical protein